jgi:hypothetical protein
MNDATQGMTLDRSTPVKPRCLLWCLLVVVLAEIALQAFIRSSPPCGGLPDDGRLVFMTGTSRTFAGVNTATVDEILRARGLADVHAFNVSRMGATMTGTYITYMEEIHPLVQGERRSGIVAIEARDSGMNDNYLTEDEIKFTLGGAKYEMASLMTRSPDVLAYLKAGEFENAAGAIVGRLALARGRSTLHKVDCGVRHLLGEETAAEWTQGAKGFKPYPPKAEAPADLAKDFWGPKYQQTYLKNYTLGGWQAQVLAELVKQVRADGFQPVLYIVPITDIHKSFSKPGEQEQFARFIRRLATHLDVPLVDLEEKIRLTDDDFYDCHHICLEGSVRLTPVFVEEVVLPYLK